MAYNIISPILPLYFLMILTGGIMKPCNLLSWHSKYSKVVQLKISLGLPMISSRDAIILGSGYHLPERNAFLVSTKTILDDTCRYCDIPKPAKGVVRMATESIFYCELIKSDVVSFKMIGRDDLKFKYMPSSVLNYVAQGHLPFDLMRTVHKTIRNFKGSVWEEKIEERGAFYTEIEDKVLEQLKKWEEGETNSEMQISEEGITNVNAKQRMQQATEAAPMSCYVADEGENLVFDGDANISQVGKRHFIALLLVAELSTMAASALCFMAFPETVSAVTPTILRVSTETLSKNLLVAIIILLLLLPFLMSIRMIASVKQQQK